MTRAVPGGPPAGDGDRAPPDDASATPASAGRSSMPSRVATAWARAVLLWLSRQHRLQQLTAGFGPARRVARRFVAGESRSDALATVAALRRDGLLATTAFLGEHTTSPAEARAAVGEYAGLLRDLAAAGVQPNCSLKLTQLGLLIDRSLAEDGLRAVLRVAAEVGGFVRIDMEGSEVLPATLDLFESAATPRNGPWRCGVVVQAYLRRSEADLRRLIAIGAPVRLVKGAYAEPPSVAYPDRADIDAAFVRLSELLLSEEARARGVYPAFATHDPAMIAAVLGLARERAIGEGGYEFQMLLGVRRDLQLGLAHAGRRVRLYVPYGSHWYPYLMRRLAERPATTWFILRNLVRR